MLTVIEFSENDGGGLALVNSSWITPRKKEVFWPPTKDLSQFYKVVREVNQAVNSQTWTTYEIARIFYECDDYEKARKKLKQAEETSDLNTDTENNQNRKRIPAKCILDSSSDEEPLSKFERPPKIKLNFSKKNIGKSEALQNNRPGPSIIDEVIVSNSKRPTTSKPNLGIPAEVTNRGFDQQDKVCATTKNAEACEQLDRSNDIKCVQHANNVGCILSIERGDTTFGTITAEEALLAANLTNNLVVVGELVSEINQEDIADYEIVIVVRKNLTEGFAGLKGLKYCHPGFDQTKITPYVLKEFEIEALRQNELDFCASEISTITEKFILALSTFFGPSCRPGQWTQDEDFNRLLKAKYPSLLKLCEALPYRTNAGKPFQQSLECVTDGYGDVAFTTRTSVKNHVSQNPGDLTKFAFLCRDGSTRALNQSCSWTRQPWNLVVANKNNVTELPQEFSTWFAGQTIIKPVPFSGFFGIIRLDKAYIPHLKIVLEFTEELRLHLTTSVSLKDYFTDFRTVPTLDSSKRCKTEIKWCTISDEEQKKCTWFSQASLNFGLQPVISCVKRSDKFECIEAIQNMGADIVMIEADHGFPALRKNLSAVAFPETKETELLRTLLIVKPKVEGIENLKGKKGCFPVYGGIAWLSFIDVGHGVVLPKDSCDYGKLISDFVGDSCMPGAKFDKYGVSSSVNREKLCALCVRNTTTGTNSSYCEADSNNLYYGNEGALKCFAEEGDFALITTRSGEQREGNYTILCKDGKRLTNSSLDVSKDCFLSIITTSEIVTRRGDPMNEDVKLVLLEFDKYFARELKTPFKIFDDFDGIKNLLFKDSTPGLDLPDSKNEGIKNYVEQFSHIDKCIASGDNLSNNLKALPLIVLISFQLLIKFWAGY